MTSSSAGEALPSVYTTRPGEALPRWLCAELAQLDRASVYETEGRRFDSCIPRQHPGSSIDVDSHPSHHRCIPIHSPLMTLTRKQE